MQLSFGFIPAKDTYKETTGIKASLTAWMSSWASTPLKFTAVVLNRR